MKFGKKKLPEPGAVKEAGKKEPVVNNKKKKRTISLVSPILYLGLASVVAAITVAASVYSYYLFVNLPFQKQLGNEVASAQLEALNLVFSEKLSDLQNLVAHYARGIQEQTYTGPAAVRELHAKLVPGVIPGALRALFSAKGQASRDKQAPLPVSFASLDLIRSVEESQKPGLDAFTAEGKWYVQVVAPRFGENKHLLGTLLVMFDAVVLQPDWSRLPAGDIQLLQTIGGVNKPVIVHGTPGSLDLTVQTSLPLWSVAYKPVVDFKSYVNPVMLAAIISAGALLAGILVAAIILLLLRKTKADISSASIYILAALKGEPTTQPKIQLSLLYSLVVQVTEFTKESNRRKTAKAPTVNPDNDAGNVLQQRATDGSASADADFSDDMAPLFEVSEADGTAELSAELEDAEPLFQGDSLDIDMLGDDDDLLGLNDDDLGFNENIADDPETANVVAEVSDEIFRAYDIRGIYGVTLNGAVMREIGRALGSEAIERGALSICVGMDGRDSSPDLAQSLTQGLLSTGLKVVNIGVVPTPVLYFAIEHLGLDAGAMVTGSHNPADYNGLKMVINGETLAQSDTLKILSRIRSMDYTVSRGELTAADVLSDYMECIVSDIAVATPLKVVIDAANGVAGAMAPELLTELGCEVIPLHCEINGSFPNHQPDPSQPENLQDLIAKVKETGADIGIALDGDGDRIGVVTNTGAIVWPDRLLMLFAKDVVSRNPGADVVFDVKCSRRLSGLISGFGGRPVMWRSGHSLMKAKMKETGALLGGEMTGHIFFKERWFGFDDGLYSAARLLEILGIDDRDAQSVFDEFPEDVSTPELHMAVTEEAKFAIMEQLEKHSQWGDATVSTIDGLRIDYADGWGLCRASNTTPNLVLRFEAETQEGLHRIQEIFREQLLALDTKFDLPF